MKILSIVSLVLSLSCAVSNVFADTSVATASAEHTDVHAHFKAKVADMSKRQQQEMNDVVNKKSQGSMDAQNKVLREWKDWRAAYLEIPGHTDKDSAYIAEQKKTQTAMNKIMFANPGVDSRKELGELGAKHEQERQALQEEYNKALAKNAARKSK